MSAGSGFAPGQHEIEGYGRGGFRFGGLSHIGSILLLPTGVHAWPVETPDALAISDFAPLIEARESFDYLLIGCGLKALSITAPLAFALRDAGLRFDLMDTPAAARTYNVLLAEKRRVAAALIAVF